MHTGIRLKEKTKKLAKIIRGINGPTRLGILYLLLHKPLEAHEIVSDIDLPANLVAHHLKGMYTAGWVNKMRIGRSVTYQINEKVFLEIQKFIDDSQLAQFLTRVKSRK